MEHLGGLEPKVSTPANRRSPLPSETGAMSTGDEAVSASAAASISTSQKQLRVASRPFIATTSDIGGRCPRRVNITVPEADRLWHIVTPLTGQLLYARQRQAQHPLVGS